MYTNKLNKVIVGQQGPAVVLLHGWGQDSSHLLPFAKLLAPFHQVHIIDLPGFGRSPIPTEVWSSEDYARAITHYINSQNLDSVHMIGHSFGGKVSLQVAKLIPQKVKKVVLAGSAGLPGEFTVKKWVRKNTLACIRKALHLWDRYFQQQQYQDWFIPRFASHDYLQAGAMRPILVKSVQEDISSFLPNIQQNTLLLWGEEDPDTPVYMGRKMQKLLPHSTLKVFPNKGHQLFNGVSAHLCAAHILPFLKPKESTSA